MKKLLPLFLIVVVFIIANSCKKDEEKADEQPVVTPELAVFDISQETNWDYWALGKDGAYLLVDKSSPVQLFYKPSKEYDGYTIYLDEYNRPEKTVIDNYIFLFGNYRADMVDIAVIKPNGDIQVVKDIEIDADLTKFMIKSELQTQDWREIVQIAGIAAGVAACAIGLATTPAGVGIPLVILGCGGTVLGIINTAIDGQSEILGVSSATIGAFSTTLDCVSGNVVTCGLGVVATSSDLALVADELIEENSEEIDVTIASLNYGGGDVQVTLTWDNTADLDLWVTDPAGEKIYYNNPYSSSGGYLDVDDTNGYGPENIFWPDGAAPLGTYLVQVHHYSGQNNSNFTVLVQAFGQIETFTGTLNSGEVANVTNINAGKSVKIDQIYKVQLNNVILPKKK